MFVRVLDSAYISEFIDAGFESAELRSIIKLEADKLSELFTDEKLKDWEVCFRFRYNNVRNILIYLKERSYKNEKYKEITIHIPIPIKEHFFWGVDLRQHLYQNENHLDSIIKNFLVLEVDYSKFDNRHDYILDSMRRAVRFCFEKGFTINGVKVKLK